MNTLKLNVKNGSDYLLLLQLANRLGIDVSDIDRPASQTVTMEMYKGTLTQQEAEQLQDYLKKSRDEWERNI
ncbi:MAG: hypothetical protein HYY40_00905 [Bacteroidetes bacterium]|nr:hypothetical protein [Bacteroidota bacterium]